MAISLEQWTDTKHGLLMGVDTLNDYRSGSQRLTFLKNATDTTTQSTGTAASFPQRAATM
jgi:hypothetical protein